MIMENYHQSYDELDHNAKSELRQSNHYTDELDTISLMKTINTIYSAHSMATLSSFTTDQTSLGGWV